MLKKESQISRNYNFNFGDHNLFTESKLVFLEKPKGYASEISQLKLTTPNSLRNKPSSPEEVEKEKARWRLTSLAIEAYFKANNIKDVEEFEEKFDFYKFLIWKRQFLVKEHGIPASEAITAGERKLANQLYYKDKNGKPVDRRNLLREKIQKNNAEIEKIRREIDALSQINTPAAKKRRNDLLAKINSNNEANNQLESKEKNLTGQLETYMYYMQRHMVVREASKNRFQQQREQIMQGSVDDYLAKGYDNILDNWAGMSGGQKFMAFAGISGIIMYLSSSKNEDMKKIWTWAKTMVFGLVGYKLVSEGISPLVSGKNIPENLDKWRSSIVKKSAFSQAFRKKGEKAKDFTARSENFMKAFMLMGTQKTKAVDVIKAYYKAKDKDFSSKKDKGVMYLDGITPGHMDGKELYLALKMYFDRYPAKNSAGQFDPPLSDTYLKKLPFNKLFTDSLAQDTGIDLSKDPVSKAIAALKRGGKKAANYAYKQGKRAVENLPRTVSEYWKDPNKLNQIISGLGDVKQLGETLLGLPVATIMKIFQGTNITAEQAKRLFNDMKNRGPLSGTWHNLSSDIKNRIVNYIKTENFTNISKGIGKHADENSLKAEFTSTLTASEKRNKSKLLDAILLKDNSIKVMTLKDQTYFGVQVPITENTQNGRAALLDNMKVKIVNNIIANRVKYPQLTGDSSYLKSKLVLEYAGTIEVRNKNKAVLLFRLPH